LIGRVENSSVASLIYEEKLGAKISHQYPGFFEVLLFTPHGLN
jgi:hypothetical protein